MFEVFGIAGDQGRIEFESGCGDEGIGQTQAVRVSPGVDEVGGELADG